MAYEIGEVVSLLIALLGYFIVLVEYRSHRNLKHLFLAYTLLLIGAVATVAEGFFLGDLLNVVEHSVGVALAGLAFGAMAFLAHKKICTLESAAKEKVRK